MPPTTRLPTGVVRALTVALRVEAQARGGQRPAARAATGRLMAVLAEAGWPAAAMTPIVGQAVPRRIDEKRWLRPGEAAALLPVHRSTVHWWRRGGLLPHTVVTAGGGQWRYRRGDLAGILRRRGAGEFFHRADGTAPGTRRGVVDVLPDLGV